jgi:hypothetical protein
MLAVFDIVWRHILLTDLARLATTRAVPVARQYANTRAIVAKLPKIPRHLPRLAQLSAGGTIIFEQLCPSQVAGVKHQPLSL